MLDGRAKNRIEDRRTDIFIRMADFMAYLRGGSYFI
jgi:hypothetical protein